MEKIIINETAGLIVNTEKVTADLIKLLNKYRKDSFGNIRNNIINHEFILSCNYIEEEKGIKKLVRCYNDLVKHGYKVDAYFAGEKVDIQMLKNWDQTSSEISKEGWEELL